MRMTYEQFLAQLRGINMEWRLTKSGTIRGKRCGITVDPITAVSQRMGTGAVRLGGAGHVAAKMGIGKRVSLRILYASDNVPNTSRATRDDLLRAIGIKEQPKP